MVSEWPKWRGGTYDLILGYVLDHPGCTIIDIEHHVQCNNVPSAMWKMKRHMDKVGIAFVRAHTGPGRRRRYYIVKVDKP